MSATDELRRLLTEAGVVWWNQTDPEPQTVTMARLGDQLIEYHENVNGTTGYHVWNMRELTPEQAITATQGSGTCKDVCNSVSEFTCSVCGFNCDLTSWISLFDGDDGRHRHHHHGTPNYCPNCGARVVGA